MDELLIDGQVFIPTKRAAAITGYAKDYIGQLCREGRIEAKLVGRSWYVLETSLREHRFGSGNPAETTLPEAPLSSTEPTEAHEVSIPADPVDTWERPSYTPEKIEEILPMQTQEEEEMLHPTSLTNTTPIEEPTYTEEKLSPVQDAWQQWFAKTAAEGASTPEERASIDVKTPIEEPVQPAATEEDVTEEETVPARPREEESVPVRLTRNTSGSMDIAPARRSEEPQGVVLSERRVRRQSQYAYQRSPMRSSRHTILKAALLGIMFLTVAVAAIGIGAIQVLSPSWVSTTPVIDFLAGVKIISK